MNVKISTRTMLAFLVGSTWSFLWGLFPFLISFVMLLAGFAGAFALRFYASRVSKLIDNFPPPEA